MEGRYGLYSQGSSGWSWSNEEDAWAVLKERKDFTFKVNSPESSTITARRLTTAARMIPRANNYTTQEPKIVQQSAPVDIPDWSKIYGKNSKKSSKTALWLDDDHDDHDDGVIKGNWGSDEEDDYEDDSDGNMIPPHEWIARKLARSQVSSFSVCEGAGRTLKGRDLSRVRHAVLTKTGFLE